MITVRMYCLPPSFQARSQVLHIHYFNNMSNLGPLSINRYRNVLRWWSHTSYPGNRTPATTLLPTSLPMMPSPAASNAFLRPSQFLVGWVVNVHQTSEKTRFQTNVLVLGRWLSLRALILKEPALQLSNTEPGLIKEQKQDWPNEHASVKPFPARQLTRFLLTGK